VHQFIEDFQKVVPLRKYFPETTVDWSEKSRFLTFNPHSSNWSIIFQIGLVRATCQHMSAENFVQIHAPGATQSSEKEQIKKRCQNIVSASLLNAVAVTMKLLGEGKAPFHC
jgi:hypothetical protein